MPNYPLVAHAGAARARAGLVGDRDLVAATTAELREARTLAVIQRAGLAPEQRERVGAALLTDTVEAWLQRTLAAAPPLTDDQRAQLARLLTADGVDQ